MKVELPPKVFTLSVGDRAILAFQTTTLAKARELTREAWLHDDLIALTSSLVPIWDGKDKLSVRVATDEEVDTYLQSERVAEIGDDLLLAYLVELD